MDWFGKVFLQAPFAHAAPTFAFIRMAVFCIPTIRSFTGNRSRFGRTMCRPKRCPVTINAGSIQRNWRRGLNGLLPLWACGLKLLSDFLSILQKSLQLLCTGSLHVSQVKSMMILWRDLGIAEPLCNYCTPPKQRANHPRENAGICMKSTSKCSNPQSITSGQHSHCNACQM